MRELTLIEFPGYCDKYTQEIKEALDLQKGLLKLNHVTIHGVIVATRNLVIKFKKNLEYEIVGIVIKTTRFRTLADFHHSYPEDAVEMLREAMLRLDIPRILNHKPDAIDRVLGPPAFLKPGWALDYRYMENPYLSFSKTQDEKGTEQLDIHYNFSKYTTSNAIMIGFQDPIPDIPNLEALPAPDPSTRKGRMAIYKQKLDVLFEQRPIWSRLALVNQLDCESSFLIHVLPYCAYLFQQGPWKKCWIKYGIDPRLDIQYRLYQSIDVRHEIDETEKRTHIYDGKTFNCSRTLQLCDIIDPEFKSLIYSMVYCRAVCSHRDGWYIDGHLDMMRDKLKNGLQALKKNPVQDVSDEESEQEQVDELTKMASQLQNILDGNDDDYFELLGDE